MVSCWHCGAETAWLAGAGRDLVVRERQIRGCGHDLDGAGGDPAVGTVDDRGGDWGLRPGQRVERGEQPRLVLLAGEHEPGTFVQVLGVRALCVECRP